MPILCSTRGAAKPGLSVSTMNALIPFRPPAAGSVRAKTVRRFATEPWVMNRLDPLRTYSSPSRAARIRFEATSRAGGGLGQGEGGQPLAARQSRKVSVLLLIGAGQEDRQRAELLDDRDQAGRRVGASDLLDEDRLRDRVEVRPAVTLLEARAEQVLLGQEVLEVVRETPPSRRSPPPVARCAPPPARARRHAARRARRWAGRSRGLLAAKFGGTGSGTVKSSRCEVHP